MTSWRKTIVNIYLLHKGGKKKLFPPLIKTPHAVRLDFSMSIYSLEGRCDPFINPNIP